MVARSWMLAKSFSGTTVSGKCVVFPISLTSDSVNRRPITRSLRRACPGTGVHRLRIDQHRSFRGHDDPGNALGGVPTRGSGWNRVEFSADLRRDRDLDPSFAIILGRKQDVIVSIGDGNDVDIQLGKRGNRELRLRIAG